MTTDTIFTTDDTTPRVLTHNEADEILREHFPHIEDHVEDWVLDDGIHCYSLDDGRSIEIEWGKQRLINLDHTGWEFTPEGCYTIKVVSVNETTRDLIYRT